MAIEFVAAGTGAGSATTATPGMPAGATTDDLLILVIEGEGEDVNDDAPPTGGAWTLVGSVASATGGAVDATRASVYRAWYDAAINRTVPDAGDHTIARIYAFSGVDTTTPIDATSTSGSSATNATSHSAVTGLSSVTNGAMAVLAYTHGDGTGTVPTGWANANLVSASDGGYFEDNSGSDGTVGLIYGIRTTAGAIGTFSWTTTASEERAWWAMVLRPAAEAPATQNIVPAAVTVTATPGTATITTGAVNIVPAATTVTATPGTATLTTSYSVTPEAVTVTATPGTATITAGPVNIVPATVTVTATPGTVTVAALGGLQDITPAATTVTVTAGTATVTPGPVNIVPGATTVTVTAGTVTAAPGTVNIVPAATTVTVTPGTVTVAGAPVNLSPAAVTVTATPGTATITTGPVNITPAATTVAVTAGTATITTSYSVTPAAVSVTATPGTVTLVLGATPITPSVVTVTVTAGTVTVSGDIFTFTPPTTLTASRMLTSSISGAGDRPHPLWKYYGGVPVGYSVLITGGAATAAPGRRGPSTDDIEGADSGSGEGGKAWFRGGLSYTINGAERTALVAAGYSTYIV